MWGVNHAQTNNNDDDDDDGAEMICTCTKRYDVMGMIFFILAVRLGYFYALKNVRHLNR